MAKNHPDYKIVRGFKSGSGFDQVYVKRSPTGKLKEIRIVEAKGPGASLSKTKTKGFQMSDEWVTKTAKAMIDSKDPATRRHGRIIAKALENGKPKITGQTIEATGRGNGKVVPMGGKEVVTYKKFPIDSP